MEDQLKSLGYAAKPKVVDEQGLQAAVADGGTVLYRGYPEAQFANQFRDGPLFGGRGIYGNGTYAAYDSPPSSDNFPRQEHKDNKAANVAANYAGPRGMGVVQRMVMAKDAKVGDHGDVVKEQQEFLKGIDSKIKGLGVTWFSRAKKQEKAKLERVRELYSGQAGTGRYAAAAAGYDAIRHPKEKYVILLNRGKVSVEDVNHKN